MPIVAALLLNLHAAGALVWTGVTFFMSPQEKTDAKTLAIQMIAAVIAVATGGRLWMLLHWGGHSPMETVLKIGAGLSLVSLAAQVLLVHWRRRVNQATIVLLAVALVAMLIGHQMAAGHA